MGFLICFPFYIIQNYKSGSICIIQMFWKLDSFKEHPKNWDLFPLKIMEVNKPQRWGA